MPGALTVIRWPVEGIVPAVNVCVQLDSCIRSSLKAGPWCPYHFSVIRNLARGLGALTLALAPLIAPVPAQAAGSTPLSVEAVSSGQRSNQEDLTGPDSCKASSGPDWAKTRHRPVIFWHGWNSDDGTFGIMKNKFAAAGYDRTDLCSESYNTKQSNRDTARQLKDLVDKVKAHSPDGSVDIVAHSMGSLSSRWYLKKLNGTQYVKNWVSIAGPNHGTRIANGGDVYAYCLIKKDQGCLEMSPTSGFLAELNTAPEAPGPTEYLTLRSNVGGPNGERGFTEYTCPSCCDKTVFSGETTKVQGAQNRVTRCYGHTDILNQQSVADTVLDALSDPPSRVTLQGRSVIRCDDGLDFKGRYDRRGNWTSSFVQTCLQADSKNQVQAYAAVSLCSYFWGFAWYYDKPCKSSIDYTITKNGQQVAEGKAQNHGFTHQGVVTDDWKTISGPGKYQLHLSYIQQGPWWDKGSQGPISTTVDLIVPERA